MPVARREGPVHAQACTKFMSKDVAASCQQQHPPVLFLDIDGVLNRTRAATHIRIDEDLVARLKTLLEETGAVIVLSTFWRPFLPYCQYILHRHGIAADAVIGRTPGISGATSFANGSCGEQLFSSSAFDDAMYQKRHQEIGAWLTAHPEVTRFAIVDDRPSAADERLAPFFVQCDAACGLTDADAERLSVLLLAQGSTAGAGGSVGAASTGDGVAAVD